MKRLIVIFLFGSVLTAVFAVPTTAQQPKPDIPAKPEGKVEYTAEDLEDPFKEEPIAAPPPPVEEPVIEKKPLPELTVQGIIWGGIFPQGIINNRVVKKGDVLQEIRVVDITKDGLVLFFQGEEYTLPSPAKASLKSSQKKLELIP